MPVPPDRDTEPPPPAPGRGRPRLSRRARTVLKDLHQRTWELEFLMSGALAVALGTLPGRIDAWFIGVFPRLGEGAGMAALLGYQYVKLILYTLIFTFLLHVVLRAFWVSLVGLDSVFPRGVRWDRVNVGPTARAYLRRHLPSVRELIVKTDGVASVLFAGAFYVVAVFFLSVAIVALVAAPMLLITSLTPWRPSPTTFILSSAVAVSALLAFPVALDRWRGDRWARDGFGARWTRATLAFNLRRLGLAAYGPVQYTLSSQLGGRRAGVMVVLVMASLTATFIVRDVLMKRERVRWDSLAFVPEVFGGAGVDPRYYEDQWAGAPVVPVPSIPTDVLDQEATFLRVFVPFRPKADPDALDRLCPDLDPVGRTGLHRVRPEWGVGPDSLARAVARSLGCATRLWDVAVDGRPVSRGDAVFARHPRTSLVGLSWYLDVRSLEAGRHVLSVRRSDGAHAADQEDASETRAPARHEIPFWR